MGEDTVHLGTDQLPHVVLHGPGEVPLFVPDEVVCGIGDHQALIWGTVP